MSGNIHDTQIVRVKREVENLQKDLDNIIKNSENITDYEITLQKRYKYLYKTSSSLFKFIYDNYKSNTFDKKAFSRNLDMMLIHIQRIQSKNISQHDASVNVGESLAKQYIPNDFFKKD
jgi:hypothetical protein